MVDISPSNLQVENGQQDHKRTRVCRFISYPFPETVESKTNAYLINHCGIMACTNAHTPSELVLIKCKFESNTGCFNSECLFDHQLKKNITINVIFSRLSLQSKKNEPIEKEISEITTLLMKLEDMRCRYLMRNLDGELSIEEKKELVKKLILIDKNKDKLNIKLDIKRNILTNPDYRTRLCFNIICDKAEKGMCHFAHSEKELLTSNRAY